MTDITESTLFKWLYTDRITTFQQTKWPVNARQWTPTVSNPQLCTRGWHLSTYTGVPEFARTNCELWTALGRGQSTNHDGAKIAFESVKLVEKVGVLDHMIAVTWAADCAERVLRLYEARYPDNPAPRQAIQAARDFVSGLIDKDAAYAAAYAANAAYAYADAANVAYAYADAAAARAAAAAAAAAARAAAAAAAVDDAAAAYAAAAAATAAAYAAAADGADAARSTERKWQTSRLLKLMVVK